ASDPTEGTEEPGAPIGFDAETGVEPTRGELGRTPADACAAARVRAPTRGNRRLERLFEAVNNDQQVLSWWHMAEITAERLGMSDHSWVHIQIVTNIALRIQRLLVKAGVEPAMVTDHAMSR